MPPLTHVTGCDWCANGVCATRVYRETIKLSYLPLFLDTRACYHPLSQTQLQLYSHCYMRTHLCGIFTRFRLRSCTRTHLSHTINPSHTHPHLPPFLAHIVCVMLCYSETVGVGQGSNGATRRGYGRYPPPTTHTPLSHRVTSLSLLYRFVMNRLLGTPH